MNTVYSILGALFLVVIIVSCSIQTFSRYVLNNSQVWTEETARYAFVWAILLGTTVVTKNWSHASLDFILNRLPRKARLFLNALTYLLILGCGIIMLVYGTMLVVKVWGAKSTACHYPISLVYLSIPVSGIGIAYHCLVHFLGVFHQEPEGDDR